MNPNHAPGLHRHTPQSGLPLPQGQLPHQQLNYHHQMVDGVGVGGGNEESGAGMNNNAHLIYVNNQQQHSGVGAGVLGDESGVCHDSPCPPMPPASWVKQRQHQSHSHHYRNQHADSLLNNNINCSSQQADVAYGAYSPQQQPIRNSFTKDELQLRQHCAYNNSAADYGNSPNVNANAMFYSSSQMEHPCGEQSSVSMYYQHQSSTSQCQDHNFQQHTSSGSDDGSFYGGGGTRNYFPDNRQQHHYASSQYHGHNHDKLLSQSNCGGGGGAGVNVNEYGSMPNDRLNYPNNSACAAGFTSNNCSRMTASPYDQVHAEFPQQHKPPTQPPFRRNSVDSYSSAGCSATESSDLGYGSKYSSGGPSFCASGGNQFPDHCHNQMKRNNGWATNVSSDEGYLYSEGQTQGQQQRQYSNSANFGPNSNSCRMTPSTSRQHSQNYYPNRSQRHCNSFDERPSTTSSPSGLMSVGGCSAAVKAAPVKQRSLSLQYPTPEPTSSINSNFEPHFNIPDINSHPRSSSASSSSSCRSNGSGIDVPVNVNMSPMSSIGSGGSSSSGDESNNSDSYPECSTTTLTLNPGPDSDSVITLHAGDPSDGDNDDCELAGCEFDPDFAVDIKCEELSEAACSTTTTDYQISESISIKCELEEQVNSCSGKMNTHSSSVSVTSTTKSSTGDTPKATPDVCDNTGQKFETTIKVEDEDDHLNNNSRSVAVPGGTGFKSKELGRVHAANLARFKELLSENSFSAVARSDYGSESSCSLNAVQCASSSAVQSTPQKISKRSLSEADKDLLGAPIPQCSTDRKDISIPVGWTRETTVSSTTQPTHSPSSESPSQNVFYVSPSGTKLRSWDELKHYITSDGTCKCGLNCPLRLERVFSFDPTVSNAHQSDLLDELLNLDEETKSRRFCCSHKRKFPRIEGSPLISSTRDDLGDNGVETGAGDNASTSKKRRTNSDADGKKSSDLSQLTTVTIPMIEQDHGVGMSRNGSGNVSMPFSQQSPDTTTQTPQRDMSPASSISSEPSTSGSGVLLNSSGGSRSSNSTPTPTSKLSPNTTTSTSDVHHAPSKWGGQYEGSWPSSSQSNSSQTQNLVTVWPTTTKKVQKISAKRSEPPCPNVDVRQIPAERNRPPPRPRSANTTSNEKPTTPASAASDASQSQGQGQEKDINIPQIQQPGVAAVNPASVSVEQQQQVSGSGNLQLNTPGYSICPMPIVPNSLPLPLQLGQLANILPLQFPFPRVLPQLNGDTLLIQPAPTATVQQTPTASTPSDEDGKSGKETPAKSDPSSSKAETENVNKTTLSTSSADSSEKSPLQCVEDVVNRVHTKPLSESLSTNTNGANNSGKDEDPNENRDQSHTGSDANKAVEASVSTGIVNFLDAAGLSIFSSPAQIPSSIMINTSLAPGATISLSNATGAVTTSSASANMPIMATAPLLNCTTSAPGALTLNPQASGSPIILQQAGGAATGTGSAAQQLRYPFFQTVQPFYLNSAGGQNSLIISPQTSDQTNSFIQIDQATGAVSAASAEMLQQAMVLDPSLLGGKKKKKRLSKKQQQQQAQLALQQQLLLQQIQQQVQAQQQVQQNIQQLIFPQSFQLGASGFSLQPMNYFQTPTILTLPNLILNPADGTLFIQQPAGTPLGAVPTSTSTSTGAVKFSGQYPLQTSPVITQSSAVLAPRKDGSGSAALTPDSVKSGCGSNELSFSSDDSRQNATPDSSTNDLQLGFIGTSNTAATPTAITVSLPLGPASTMMTNKKPSKSKAVSSSSSTQKRILPQKQILPKIDSTTPSTDNH